MIVASFHAPHAHHGTKITEQWWARSATLLCDMAHHASVVLVAADANATLGSVQDGRVGGCCPEPEN
eukprot:8811169-Alexandrium_andersonii.AAC.1